MAGDRTQPGRRPVQRVLPPQGPGAGLGHRAGDPVRPRRHARPAGGEIAFREWHDRWWNARIVEPHTLRGDASSIKNHVMPYWADWEMRAITRMDVQSWIRSLVEKGAGPAAIKRAYNLTSSLMRAAVDDDELPLGAAGNSPHWGMPSG
ncbi:MULTISPECIES: hypothetical protein [Streptomyces]|uniref:hypothetical protein n=1 Tax=Streptomyces TaxID=1883 RepID=UPI002872C2EC|nr:hypothetical protein [Streptomyces murinus]